ncbi:MAG: hypothetical protein VZS44_01680 [Bacilli bacterium]|nr:hypothetical protein [Bacilli bacterium]
MKKKNCIIVLYNKKDVEGIIDYNNIDTDYDNDLINHFENGMITFYEDKENDKYDIKIYANSLSAIKRLLKNKSLDINDLNIFKINIDKPINKHISILDEFKDQIKIVDFKDLELKDIKKIINKNSFADDTEFIIKYENCDVIGIKKQELINIFNYIEEITNFVKRFNLSPLEQAIFVYDLLKEREYKKQVIEQQEEDKEKLLNNYPIEVFNNGRSLSKVLNSDEIVCVGYANIYAAILNDLNITTTVQPHIGIGKSGHANNLVYINDKKYKVNGLFEVDCTYDSMNKGYKFFGKTLNESLFNKLDTKIYTPLSEIIKRLDNRIERLNYLLELKAPAFLILQNCLSINNSFIEFYKLVNDKQILKKHLLLKKEILELSNTIEQKNNTEKQELTNIFVEKVCQDYHHFYHIEIPIDTFISASYIAYRTECSIGLINTTNPLQEYKQKINYKYVDDTNISKAYLKKIIFGDPDDPIINKLYYLQEQISKLEPVNKIEASDEIIKPNIDLARMQLLATLHDVANDNYNSNPIMPKSKKR